MLPLVFPQNDIFRMALDLFQVDLSEKSEQSKL